MSSAVLSSDEPAMHGRRKGRKRSWWVSECFSTEPVSSSNNTQKTKATCRYCHYTSIAATVNATQLGKHLVSGTGADTSVRSRIANFASFVGHHRKLGSFSSVYGVPETPAEKKRRRKASVSTEHLSKRNLSRRQNSFADAESQESFDSYAQRTKFNELLTSLIVNHVLPFSVLSRQPGEDELYQLLKLANPVLAQQVPTVSRMGSKNLNAYYERMMKEVKSSVTVALAQNFGTLVFDGWTDGQSASVVNILLSITGIQRSRKTLFLRSIYTASLTVDAELYASVIRQTMAEFGAMRNICGITSDNTGCCIKAKDILVQEFGFLYSCQDQTHLAIVLMQDIGCLQWINDTLKTITTIVTDLRTRPKLYSRFAELCGTHNGTLRNNGYVASNREFDEYGRPKPPRTAVMPVKMATTRFASSEGMLESFIRARSVYISLIDCSDFSSNLYGGRNDSRRALFEFSIRDESLLEKCVDAYHILRAVRQYLRIFDIERSILSEVFPATERLRQDLDQLPVTRTYTSQRKCEVLTVFSNRLEGVGRKLSLVNSLHYVAYCLDLRSAKRDLSEFDDHVTEYMTKFVESDAFPPAEKVDGVQDAAHALFAEYNYVRGQWEAQCDDQGLTGTLRFYQSIPITYWLKKKEFPMLREFALRILSTSPSSSSVERSFSLQGRIRTSLRNRLHPEKVKKLIFCASNSALFNEKSERRSRRSEYKPSFQPLESATDSPPPNQSSLDATIEPATVSNDEDDEENFD